MKTNTQKISLTTPLTDSVVSSLQAGDLVLLSGRLYTARDAAHKRLVEHFQKEGKLPFSLKGEVIYYVGPAPAKPGYPIGPAGPTTSYRMDPYTPLLLQQGLKGMIGKGLRSKEVIEAIQKEKAVYFTAVGGAAALISKSIISSKVILYEDLGTEAIRELVVKDFPAIVTIDCFGRNLYDRE